MLKQKGSMKAKNIDAWPLIVGKRKRLLDAIKQAAEKQDYEKVIFNANRLAEAHRLVEKAYLTIN
jgi:hypothetical protein